MISTPTTTATPAASKRAPARQHLTLGMLAERTLPELDAMYRSATVSTTMHAADGALRGRMLAVRGLPGVIGAQVRRFAASSAFVWDGKTFAASSATRGVGHNRVSLPRVLGRQNLFPFDTRFGASAIDGRPTLILDYDLDANPSYIRHIHDEIRELEPGLFLGPAMWKGAAGAKALLLYFALDARMS